MIHMLERGKHVYLAGPMRGIPHFNFPAFMTAAEHIRSQGYRVFNPAERDNKVHNADISENNHTGDVNQALCEHGFNLRLALSADLKFICEEADGIVLLDGWESSKGARAEHAAAEALGLVVIHYSMMRRVPQNF